MWKKFFKFLLMTIVILGSSATIFKLYLMKKQEKENEFSDIFEEDDFDLDESL